MAQPARKLRVGTASARSASREREAAKEAPRAPRRPASVRGSAVTTAQAKDRHGVYHDTTEQEAVGEYNYESGEHPARVRMEASLTINMGDYNSLKLGCSVELPCRPGDIDAAYETAAEFVSAKLTEEETRWVGK